LIFLNVKEANLSILQKLLIIYQKLYHQYMTNNLNVKIKYFYDEFKNTDFTQQNLMVVISMFDQKIAENDPKFIKKFMNIESKNKYCFS